MADQVCGKSRYEVAHEVALQIITIIEKKKLSDVSRQHYLHTLADAHEALGGIKDWSEG